MYQSFDCQNITQPQNSIHQLLQKLGHAKISFHGKAVKSVDYQKLFEYLENRFPDSVRILIKPVVIN